MRRKMSVSVRTVVVLPVPPFWERTAIVEPIGAHSTTQRAAETAVPDASPSRVPRARPSLCSGTARRAWTARRRCGACSSRSPPADVDVVQAVAADDDLVAVGQRAPLDPLAVDEHAVEAAVVEHAHAVGLAHDQRVAARDGRVVEAHVGGEAAADPRPLARSAARPPSVALLEGEVLPGLGDQAARLVEAARRSRAALSCGGAPLNVPVENSDARAKLDRRSRGRKAAGRRWSA